MNIKPQIALTLSSLLLSVGVARAQAPTAPKPQTPTVTPQTVPAQVAPPSSPVTSIPASGPLPESEAMSPEEMEELVRQTVRESLEDSRLVDDRVEAALDRQFSWTFGLLNTLLGVLVFSAIAGTIALWFVRRSTVDRVMSEVEGKTERLRVELERGIAVKLAHSGRLPGGPPMKETPTENPAQLKEMVSMALSVQNLITNARTTLEETAQAQNQFSQQLQDLFDYQMKEAQTLMGADRYSEALTLYEKAAQLKPKDLSALCGRGAALIQLQRYDEAIATYDGASHLDADNSEIYYAKARCLALRGDAEQALATLKHAIQLNPKIREMARSDPDFASIWEDESTTAQ